MLVRMRRLFKHRWADEAHRSLSQSALERLHSRIALSETSHTGEIRICVESGLPNSYLLRSDTTPALLRQRALAQFGRLRVWDTEANNGVLIYLCLAERALELVADRGVNRLATSGQWEQLVKRLSLALKEGHFEQGLLQAVEEVDAVLLQHFALRVGQTNPNELPDAPVLS